ncbi:hypothetical protein ABZP36_035773 [Zizania latifolia]
MSGLADAGLTASMAFRKCAAAASTRSDERSRHPDILLRGLAAAAGVAPVATATAVTAVSHPRVPVRPPRRRRVTTRGYA